jgi:4-hydroxy-tetrahydrodipicolinate synthase
MAPTSDFSGVYVPLITPFDADGGLALAALERLAEESLDAGAAGLVALGTTGEAATLTSDERRAVVGVCAHVTRAHRSQLIVGVGSNDTRSSAQALMELKSESEVAAALTVVPYYTRPSEAGIEAHFSQLARESPVPLIIYNIPYRTGRYVRQTSMLRLAQIPGIVGVKHAVGGIDEDTVTLMAQRPAGFAILGGDDIYLSAMLGLGADGGILASSHVCTGEFVTLVGAWRAGDVARARPLGHRLAGLAAALFAEPNPAVIKGVLYAQGRIPSPAVRLPLLPAGVESTEKALEAISKVKTATSPR